MTLSGDVEDVSVQLTQTRFKDQVYQIDAIVLNEQTSADMLDADVDRHFIAKQVMPVIMAGLSGVRSEEHTSELQSLMRISYAVFCLKQKKTNKTTTKQRHKY